MPDIHSIRLREPWQCEPCESGVRWSRSFNWPAGLTPREKVWIVVDPLPADARVTLNGQSLGEGLEITRLIGLTNRVEIELPQGRAGELPFAVRIDIDEG
ncbi:hypothetical protein [Bythopirellula goksoeyrii]|uniref:Uncharacterized protein n=1 Tax=Bythopirellula goksoeyrii TaxID=1400387 RepID=A0A5B9Q560_9BACT|nr:hypothetical protein [Bythopirellula goksoeyrii]QEG32809.1 hypothetical protein Pr1d_00690 [Bythopirellula goksoeyrii]